MNKKYAAGFYAAIAITTSTVTAAEPEFKETQVLLQGENVKQFALQDLNGDLRPDVVWLTAEGEVKYKLQDNKAIVTFENIKGTKWRLTYDVSGVDKWVEFFNEGGVVTTQNNLQYNIVAVTVTELNQLSFCTDHSTGLYQKECEWKYQVNEVLPNVLKGKDLKSGETWTAYKLIK